MIIILWIVTIYFSPLLQGFLIWCDFDHWTNTSIIILLFLLDTYTLLVFEYACTNLNKILYIDRYVVSFAR